MANPEIQNNNLSGVPTNKPSDTLLKNFRATLDQRWKEFDWATLQEAQQQVNNSPLGWFTDAKTERNKDPDFIKAKATFDEAMSVLGTIDTDAKLKQILETPGQLSSVINNLKDYLAKADKQKSYNTVLSHTLADLTGLKAQMTERAEDKKEAELAQAAVPVTIAATTGILGTGAIDSLNSAMKEQSEVLGTELSAIKKNPMKKIAEFFGFSESSIISDYKEALAEKNAGGFDAVFAGIKVWFYGFLAKLTGTDIAKSLSPEERKLAGFKEPEVQPNASKEGENKWTETNNRQAVNNILYTASYTWLIVFHKDYLAKKTGETIASKNKTQIQEVFGYSDIWNLSYSEAQSLYSKYKNTSDLNSLIQRFPSLSKIDPKCIFAAISLICDDSLFSTKIIKKNVWNEENITILSLLSKVHGDFSIASDFERIDPKVTVDPEKIFSQVFWDIGARFWVSKDTDGNWKFNNSETQEHAISLWLSPAIISEIMIANVNINTISTEQIDAQAMTQPTKDFLKKLVVFWKQTKGTLSKNFSFDKEQEFTQFYNSADIKPNSIMKLFIVSWWNTDLGSLSWPRKLWVYSIIRESFFAGSPENISIWAALFDKSIIAMGTVWALSPTDWDKYVSRDVQEAMKSLASTVSDNLMDATWGSMKNAWTRLPAWWKVWVWAWTIVSLFILWRLRGLKWAAVGATAGAALTATLFAWAVYAWLSPNDKKKFPKEQLEQDAEKWLRTMFQ